MPAKAGQRLDVGHLSKSCSHLAVMLHIPWFGFHFARPLSWRNGHDSGAGWTPGVTKSGALGRKLGRVHRCLCLGKSGIWHNTSSRLGSSAQPSFAGGLSSPVAVCMGRTLSLTLSIGPDLGKEYFGPRDGTVIGGGMAM